MQGEGTWELRGGDPAGGTVPSLASTPHRQAKQNNGSDQEQPRVHIARQFHSEEVGGFQFLFVFTLCSKDSGRGTVHISKVLVAAIFSTSLDNTGPTSISLTSCRTTPGDIDIKLNGKSG